MKELLTNVENGNGRDEKSREEKREEYSLKVCFWILAALLFGLMSWAGTRALVNLFN